MPGEDKDLMQQVGDSFGIKDAPSEPTEGDSGGDVGQQDLPLSHPQLEGDQSGAQTGEQTKETGSDPGRSRQGDKQEQLFNEKPRRGPRGELLDKNGQVIASTRREKQLAFNLNRAQYAVNQAKRDAQRATAALGQFQELNRTMQQNNISPQMAREALELRAMAERDPILAVRDIVARVLASGVTMDQLFGNDAVPSINARVITNELDRRLGPTEQRERAIRQQVQIEQRAQEQMEIFVQDHPHAETHGVEISNLVSNHGLTPERAYFELRSWVERRGFDFTSPLKPQIDAAMKRKGGNGGRSTPGSMRGVGNSAISTQNGSNSRGDFRSNTPWRDIAAAVFTELNSK